MNARKELYYTRSDLTRFHAYAFFMPLAIYGVLGLTVRYQLPWYVVLVLVGPALSRWSIAVHELFHLQPRPPIWIRALPLPFSPINGGWAEHRAEHMGHHRHTATPEDSEWWRIRGGRLRSFIACLFVFEGVAYHHLRANGWRMDGWWAFRILLFCSVFYMAGSSAFSFWAGLRLAYALQDWAFNHLLHYQHGEYGTFRMSFPAWLVGIGSFFYGSDTVNATMDHDIHHQFPNVAAWNLAQMRERVQRTSVRVNASPSRAPRVRTAVTQAGRFGRGGRA
ncbi:MAG: hypothetical protein ACI8PZ_006521 [Myxococcota bacterium]|jgi:hypothetical protein